jgi:hypothetical protein
VGGETEKSVSGWSVDTLKEYVERVVSDLRLYLDSKLADLKEYLVQQAMAQAEAVKAALAAAEKAVNKAEANVEKWRESQNEWRAAMSDREKEFARKAEVKAQVEHLEKLAESKFKANSERIDRHEARISALEQRGHNIEGQSSGRKDVWGYVVGAVGLAGALIAIFFALSR